MPSISRIKSVQPRRLTILLTVLLSASPRFAYAAVLYDVNFDSPNDVLNQAVPVGQGSPPRHTASSINFGQPMVRSSAATLDGQFCQFDGAHVLQPPAGFPYCQLQFSLDPTSGLPSYPFYRIAFDVVVQSLAAPDDFTIITDNPAAEWVVLNPEGTIRTNFFPSTDVATYVFGSRLHFQIDGDIAHQHWNIFLNNQQIVSGAWPVDFPFYMKSVRFNLTAASSASSVGIDNIRIEGIPEPKTLALFMVMAFACVLRCRKTLVG